MLLGPLFALAVNIFHEALNELVLSVMLKIEILIFGGLAAVLGRVHKLAALVQVQIHHLQVNICISHQLDLANAKHLRL